MTGWAKLYRELLDKSIWKMSTPEQKTILITLLLMANHEDKSWEWRGEQYQCRPGEFITSLEKIVEKCGKGVTIQNVRTALKRFEKLEFLTDKSTKQGRLISIVNWGIYQSDSIEPDKESNSQLTDSQQTTNRQLTPNKNNKNNKNNKKIERGGEPKRFTPPTLESVMGYCREVGIVIDCERFIDFYESKDWMVGNNRMKDWKAAVRNWERRDKGAGEKRFCDGAKKNNFNNIPQRDYDFDELERQLLNR